MKYLIKSLAVGCQKETYIYCNLLLLKMLIAVNISFIFYYFF